MRSRRTRWILAVVATVAILVVATRQPAVGTKLREIAPRTEPSSAVAGSGSSGSAARSSSAGGADRVQPGPLDLSGDLDGASYRMVVPAHWNGTLLVFAHGYRAAGPDEDHTVPIAPTHADTALLMSEGYALAGTAFRSNGWALDVAVDDLHALAQVFTATVAEPRSTLAWGESMGGLVVAAALEAHPDTFDGAVSLCGIIGGATNWWDTNGLTLARAYDAAFGWPAEWGTAEAPRADLQFWTDVAPTAARQIEDPAERPRWEFIRLVIGAPMDDFYAGGALLAMSLATTGRADLMARAGGQPLAAPADGYHIADDLLAALAFQGLDAPPLLDHMNAAATVAAPPDPAAREWLAAHNDPVGTIQGPMLALHTQADTLVPASNLTVYAERVGAAGHADLLITGTAEVAGGGHCRFDTPQLAAAAQLVDRWVTSGQRPAADELTPILGQPAVAV
jgi:pimeloyl-ACP methyl ester carboxylesterase